jgi:hypothetical protein
MKIKKHLNFKRLREILSGQFRNIPEYRQKNKINYSIHDALMSGFACMCFQDPSLLQFQERLEKKHHKNNLQTLFDIEKIPESTQLRSITDSIDSTYFSEFFNDYLHWLGRGKHLEQYQLLPGKYYIAMDATDYFSSYSISCEKCLKTKPSKKGNKKNTDEDGFVCEEHEGSIRYSHKALQMAIMHPDIKQVIPLMPEEISNIDGASKQDCETNAAKRLIPKLRKAHPQLGIIMGGDDLFSRQPMIETVLSARMNYIFVAKPESHAYMMEWLTNYPKLNEHEIVEVKKKIRYVHRYQWMNNVPLHGGENAIKVNYFNYQVYKINEKNEESYVYKNSWVTDIEITKENIQILSSGGRCRWRIESVPQAHKVVMKGIITACKAIGKMMVGPSKLAVRSGFQTTPSGFH